MFAIKGFHSFWSILAVLICGGIMAASVLAPYLSPYDPLRIDMNARLEGPGPKHLLGTDALGRDYFSRMLHGGRMSIGLAFLVTAISMVTGLVIGISGGYFRGVPDAILLGITTVFQGLPGMTLMVAIAGIMGPGIDTLLVALPFTGWMGFSRIVRGEVMKIQEETFMEVAKALGAGNGYRIFRHILPNLRALCLITFTTRMGRSLILISSLTYLGFGLEPPAPDWGAMVRDAVGYFRTAPHLILAPGACLFLLTFSIHMIGDSLMDYFDVRYHISKE